MAPHPHLHGAHIRHLQSPTTHPELLRLLWDKGTWPPEIEPWISAFLCCWGQRWRGMNVTVTPASSGEPGGPRRAELHQCWHLLWDASWKHASQAGRPVPCRGEQFGVQLPLGFLCRCHLPLTALHTGGGVGSGGGEGWFVFPLLCFKIPPPAVPCETGLSPGTAASALPHPGNAPG